MSQLNGPPDEQQVPDEDKLSKLFVEQSVKSARRYSAVSVTMLVMLFVANIVATYLIANKVGPLEENVASWKNSLEDAAQRLRLMKDEIAVAKRMAESIPDRFESQSASMTLPYGTDGEVGIPDDILPGNFKEIMANDRVIGATWSPSGNRHQWQNVDNFDIRWDSKDQSLRYRAHGNRSDNPSGLSVSVVLFFFKSK